MWLFWQRHAPVWSPADEGGQGGGEQSGEGGEAGDGGSGEGGNEGDQGGSSSILDFANKAGSDGNQGADAWKLPDGLEIPEHLVGTSAEDTLSKLSKAYKGARQEVSKRGKGEGQLEGSVPDSPDGYTFEADGDDDAIAAELNSEASKPIMDAFKKAAHKHNIPDKAFASFLRDGIADLAEQGIAIGSDEDATKISGEAEMKALADEVGQQEAGTIINTISSYGEKLAARGVLQDETDVAEFTQMVGTARAARIFHRILTGELGEKPIPAGIGMDGSITPQEAMAAQAKALKMPQGAERDEALADAQRKLEKAYGSQSSATGSVRSSVL